MSSVLQAAMPLTAFVVALWLTGRVRRFAVQRQLLDIPNERSSHTVATPRGGGVAIVLTTLVMFLALGVFDVTPWQDVLALVGGGALVALIGFLDDRASVAPRWRLLGHFVAAGWVIGCLNGLPALPLLGVPLSFGWFGYVLATLFVVWLINLTNFMDGIDGMAGVEAIAVCVGGCLLYVVAAPRTHGWMAPLILAAATTGFLAWNWPPARIFLGDAGSGFLGLVMAAFALQAGWVLPRLFFAWIILLGVFIVDATVTLVRRVTDGEQFYVAHRHHAYQHAAQVLGTHRPVIIAVGLIDLLWLLPVSLLVAIDRLGSLTGLVIGYLPLFCGAVYWRAGKTARVARD